MTESITDSGALAESNLLGPTMGTIGYGCSMASVLISAYSPLLATPGISSPVTHGITHALMFLAMAFTFFCLYRFAREDCDRIVCSKRLQIVALAMQLALPIVALLNNLGSFVAPIPVNAVAWLCFGAASAFFTCAWTTAQNAIEEERIRSVNFLSFCIAACISLCVLCMPAITGVIALVALCVTQLALLMCAPHRGSAVLDRDSSEWFAKSGFKKSGSYVMFVNGVMLSVFAGLLVARVSKYALPPAAIGISFIATAAIFYAVTKKAPFLLSLGQAQLVFLPIIICGVMAIGFLDAPWNTAAALVLFIVLYLLDYANTSVLSLRGRLLSISPCYCFSRGRMFIIAGQAVGWLVGAALAGFGRGGLPVVSFVLVGLVCLYISTTSIGPHEDSAGNSEEMAGDGADLTQQPELNALPPKKQEEHVVQARPYRNKCVQAARRFDLTPREGEILVFLAKGRNAKYIADQLIVAERTVKTHAYHIYQKMGIHSQQELIDIVEAEPSIETEGPSPSK